MTTRRALIASAVILSTLAAASVPRTAAVPVEAPVRANPLERELKETRQLAARYASALAGCLNGQVLKVGNDEVRCVRQ